MSLWWSGPQAIRSANLSRPTSGVKLRCGDVEPGLRSYFLQDAIDLERLRQVFKHLQFQATDTQNSLERGARLPR